MMAVWLVVPYVAGAAVFVVMASEDKDGHIQGYLFRRGWSIRGLIVVWSVLLLIGLAWPLILVWHVADLILWSVNSRIRRTTDRRKPG